MKRYGARISVRDTGKWVAGTILAIHDLDVPKQLSQFRSVNWGDGRWLYVEIELTDEEVMKARNRKLKLDLSKLLLEDVVKQRGIANRVNLHHQEIKEAVFSYVENLNREESQIYATGQKVNIDFLQNKKREWRTQYDPIRKKEMKKTVIAGTNALRNSTAGKVEECGNLTLPEKLAAIRFHKNLYVNHKDAETQKYRDMNEAEVWRLMSGVTYIAFRHFRGMIKRIEDVAKLDITDMGAKPEILKVFTGADLLGTPKKQYVADYVEDCMGPIGGTILPGMGLLGVILMLIAFIFSFQAMAPKYPPAPLDKYSTRTIIPDAGLNALDPTYTVGDGKTYSTIQAAIDAIPGNLSGQGVQTVEVYAKAPSNIYAEIIRADTGFSNESASDYIHTVAMVDHTGLAGVGIKIFPAKVDAWISCYVTGPYGHLEGFECSIDGSNAGDINCIYVRANCKIYNNIVHDITATGNSSSWGLYLNANAVQTIYNNIIYNVTGTFRPYGIMVGSASDTGALIYNNTIVNIIENGAGYGAAIRIDGDNATFKNNYLNFQVGTGASWEINGAGCVHDYNVTSDALGAGEANGIGSAAVNDQFVNPGTDFHLKVGADCIDAGVDLSGTFTGDIDGDTRTGSWDVGADELIDEGVGLGPYVHQTFANQYEPGAWR